MITEHTPSIREAWIYQNVDTYDFDRGAAIAANNGKLFILSGARYAAQKLIAFDGITGNELWHIGVAGDIITASSSMVFVADCNAVSAFDVNTGEKLWSKSYVRVSSGACINSIVTDGNKLYILGINRLTITLNAQNGDEIITEPYTNNSHAKVALETGLPVVIDLSFYQGNILYRREGWHFGYGPISAVNINPDDVNNYDIVWHSSYDYASNIAPAKNGVFALTSDGQVLFLDSKNGGTNQVVSFTPAKLNFSIGENCSSHLLYDVKFDDVTNMLFVVLGDSNRLYAFELR